MRQTIAALAVLLATTALAQNAPAPQDPTPCAIVVDARGLTPTLAASEAPALATADGKLIWPNPELLKGLSSKTLGESGLARYFSDPARLDAALARDALKPERVLRLKAVAAARNPLYPASPILAAVTLSKDDAEKVTALGKNCQAVFLK